MNSGIISLALGLAVLAGQPVLAQDSFVASAGQAVVKVAQGELQGAIENGIYSYRGVPYAKAERFMAPQPPDNWDGVRLAMNYGEICPIPAMDKVATDEQFNPHRYFPQSEKCQFLNVWSPGINDDAKRPVLVFLHGGGFTNGSSIEGASYEGANMARLGDMVVVTLNHRLNVLGALDLSAFGDSYAASANTGMRDIVAALQWVQSNISAFGGDPDNVTIMGQSGGGGKVRFLMGAPDAKDLFDKAIVMSGAGNIAALPREVASAVGEKTIVNLGLTPETISKVAEVPYEDLLAAGNLAIKQINESGLATGVNWRPNVDGSFMPADPVSEGWAKYAADKPLMVGNVMDESSTIIRNDNSSLFADNWTKWPDDKTMAKLTELYGDRASPAAEAWKRAYPKEPLSRLAFFTPAQRASSLKAAEVKAASGSAPVYNYLVTWDSPVLDGIAGTWHVADVPLAMYTVDLVPQAFGGGMDARAMSYDVSRAFINFARSGNPNHAGLPEWPAYTAENGATMLFDNYSTVGLQHDKGLLEILTASTGG